MRLKYYLRGLGAGILFSVLVFAFIVGPKEAEISDEEIIQRAKQLGLREVNIDMEKLRDNDGTGTPTPTSVPTPTSTPTPTSVLTPTSTPTPVVEPTSPPVSEVRTVTVEVTRGMTSERIAHLIETEGVVESAMELNAYLIRNGFAEQLRVGKFVLRTDMTFDEIATTLTR